MNQGGATLESRAKNVEFCEVFASSGTKNVVFLQVSEGLEGLFLVIQKTYQGHLEPGWAILGSTKKSIDLCHVFASPNTENVVFPSVLVVFESELETILGQQEAILG